MKSVQKSVVIPSLCKRRCKCAVQVHDSRERARQQSSPPLEVLVAISDLVAVVEREAAKAQQSAACGPSVFQGAAAAADQSLPMLCPITEPASPSGSFPAQLSADDALWLPSTVAAALQYLECQAPGLLHPDVSDLLLDATCCVR